MIDLLEEGEDEHLFHDFRLRAAEREPLVAGLTRAQGAPREEERERVDTWGREEEGRRHRGIIMAAIVHCIQF